MVICIGEVSTLVNWPVPKRLMRAASYFWSPEFWGGIRVLGDVSRDQRRSIYLFGFLVFIGGFLALFAGPASAVLIIPQVVSEPYGGAIFWLNGQF